MLSACTPQKTIPVGPEDSDLAVYRAVLDSMFVAHRPGGVEKLVVFDSTTVLTRENLTAYPTPEFTRLPGVDSATVRNLVERSYQRHSLAPLQQLGLAVAVSVFDRNTLLLPPRITADRFWTQFYERYPKSAGLVMLSPVGYSTTGDVAILIVDMHCGLVCGQGHLVVVRRLNGAWKIATIKYTWVS